MKAIALGLLFSLLFFSDGFAQFYTIRAGQAMSSNVIVATIKPAEEKVPIQELAKATNPDKEELWERFDPNKFCVPLDEPLFVTSPYGYRQDPFTGKRRFHAGIDLRANNDKVYSMLYGTVKKVGSGKRGLGNYVVLKHGNFEVTYAHLEYVFVEKGDNVRPGDIVAVSGNTGRSTGPHLHIEVKYRGKRSNPLPLLAFIEKTYSIQTKLTDKIMTQEKNNYLTALEHVQADYADEFSAWLDRKSLFASEETAMLFLDEIEDALNSETNEPL